jgi:predicted alpha/beta superfamily hydrolase
MDGDGHLNEVGSIIDFLVANGRMPRMIVVGIPNPDRTRDLTPYRAGVKNPDRTVQDFPTSGGGDKFLEFIRTELFPEVEKRYATVPYRIFAGHSLGGLMAIHALITHPEMFNAYIAISPSLQWDDGLPFARRRNFLPKQKS